MTAVIVTVWLSLIAPALETMRELRRVMCSGNLDYVSSQEEVGFVVGANISAKYRGRPLSMDSYSFISTLQPSGLKEVAHHSDDYWMPSTVGGNPIQTLPGSMRMETWVTGALCMDFTVWFPKLPSRALLRELLDDTSIEGCMDVVPYCIGLKSYSLLSAAIRSLCPVSCGCNQPSSGTVYAQLPNKMSGCPVSCTAEWTAALAKMPCKNVPADNKGFRDAVDEYKAVLVEGLKMANATSFGQTMKAAGCSSVHKYSLLFVGEVDMCRPSSSLKSFVGSLAPLCPEQCNCTPGGAASGMLCPGTC